MIVCANCRNASPEGTLFCESCGELFLAPDVPADATHAPAQTGAAGDTITFEVAGASRKLVARLDGAPIVLGRADPATGFAPGIELTPFGALRLGVSRRHAMVSWGSYGVTIEDLESYNGIYVNGERLPPHQRHAVHDGDEITLGDMALFVRFG